MRTDPPFPSTKDQLDIAESELQSLRQQVEEQSQAANENQNVAFSAQEEMVKANRVRALLYGCFPLFMA